MARSIAASTTLSENHERYKSGEWELAKRMIDNASRSTDIAELLKKPRAVIKRLLETKDERLSSKDWIRLAQEIERAKLNSEEEPRGLRISLTLLGNCISLRRENGFYYRQAAVKDATPSSSDIRHEAFLETVVCVQQILLSLRKVAPAVEPDAAAPNIPSCRNLDPGLEAPGCGKREDPAQLKANQESESAATFTLKALEKTRAEICSIWTKCHGGEISIETASAIHEDAVSQFLKISSALVERNPRFKTYEGIVRQFEVEAHWKNGNLTQFRCKQSGLGSTQCDDMHLPNLFCVTALTICKLLETSMAARKQQGSFETNGQKQREVREHLKTVHPFGSVVVDIWPELENLSRKHDRGQPSAPPLDLFSKTMVKFASGHTMDLDMVALMQIQCDIGAKTGLNQQLCQRTLLRQAEGAMSDMYQLHAMHDGSVEDEGATLSYFDMPYVLTRTIGVEVEETGGKTAKLRLGPMTGNLPFLAGVRLAKFSSYFQSEGAELWNWKLVIPLVAHLYDLLQCTGHLKRPWAAMEHLIQQQIAQAFRSQDVNGQSSPVLLAAQGLRLLLDGNEVSEASLTSGEPVSRFDLIRFFMACYDILRRLQRYWFYTLRNTREEAEGALCTASMFPQTVEDVMQSAAEGKIQMKDILAACSEAFSSILGTDGSLRFHEAEKSGCFPDIQTTGKLEAGGEASVDAAGLEISLKGNEFLLITPGQKERVALGTSNSAKK